MTPRFWRKFRFKRNSKNLLTLTVVLFLMLIALPWPLRIDQFFPNTILGVPSGYFLVTFGMPIAMLFLVIIYMKLVPDIEAANEINRSR